MTAKRFTYEYDEHSGNLFDNKMNTFYHIEDSDENIEVLCDRLNWLVDENEQLKLEYKVLHTQYQDLKNFVENNFDEHLTQEKLNRQIIKLSEENKQLKQQLQSILKLIKKIEDCIHDMKLIGDLE